MALWSGTHDRLLRALFELEHAKNDKVRDLGIPLWRALYEQRQPGPQRSLAKFEQIALNVWIAWGGKPDRFMTEEEMVENLNPEAFVEYRDTRAEADGLYERLVTLGHY
jgi:hypothetical protein